MNLNEAIKVLNANNYIVEFLQDTTVMPEKFISRLEKEFNIKIMPVKEKRSFSASRAYNTKYFTTDLNFDDLTDSEKTKIKNIAKIFNMQVNMFELKNSSREVIKGTHFTVWPVSLKNSELEYKPITNYNLFLHNTVVKPEVINRTGLRAKQYNSKEDYILTPNGWGGVEEGGEGRIYMQAIDMSDLSDIKSPNELAEYIVNSMDYGYAEQHYLIKLPKNYPVRHDPEAEEDMGWVYTIQNIPSKFILYLGREGENYDTGEVYSRELAVTIDDIVKFIDG